MKRLESNEVNIMPKAMLHYKYIMMTLVILTVTTLLVAIFALATNYKYMDEIEELRAQNQHNSDLATQMLRETRAAGNENTKCKSLLQDELPAANLFGKRPYTVTQHQLERDVPSHMETGVYRWLTSHHDYGLLTGGMTFNETNGHLRIPKNGTYYMFTTVRFRRNKDSTNEIINLTVDIKIISTCNKYYNTGFNPKHSVAIPKGKVGSLYSTHTSGIARLCENDVIYLHIHDMPRNFEIRNGGGAFTNLGAFMIAPRCEEYTDDGPATTDTDSPPTTDAKTTPTTASTQPSTEPTTTNPRCDRRSECPSNK